jgi:hypothetical protein
MKTLYESCVSGLDTLDQVEIVEEPTPGLQGVTAAAARRHMMDHPHLELASTRKAMRSSNCARVVGGCT